MNLSPSRAQVVLWSAPVASSRFGATVWPWAQQDVRSSSPCCEHTVRSNSAVWRLPQSLRFSTSGRCHQRADWKAILVIVLITVTRLASPSFTRAILLTSSFQYVAMALAMFCYFGSSFNRHWVQNFMTRANGVRDGCAMFCISVLWLI